MITRMRSQSASAMNGENRPVYAAFAFLLCATALLIRAPHPNLDFNLYYMGGLVERSSTYTDNAAVFAHMAASGLKLPLDGVYGTPTLVALVFQPLSFVPLRTAHAIFYASWILLTMIAVRKAAPNCWPAWLAVAVLAPAGRLGLSLGNISVITFGLIVYSYGSLRHGQKRAAGIALGVAMAFKAYPAFLVLPLLMQKKWAESLWAIGTTAALLLITVPALGLKDVDPAVRSMVELSHALSHHAGNFSIPKLVLDASASQSATRIADYVGVLFFLAVIWRRRMLATPLTFALAIPAMLLVQGISWRNYADILLIPLCATFEYRQAIGAKPLVALSALLGMGIATQSILSLNLRTIYIIYTYRFGCFVLLITLFWQTRKPTEHAASVLRSQRGETPAGAV